MKTSFKLLSGLIIIVSLLSCNFSGVVGSKNVIKQNREITDNFEAVKVSTGIDLVITQGSDKKLIVEADDNIIDLLITEVKDGVLKIYFNKNVSRVKSKKVYLTMSKINSITATSGASAENKEELKGGKINLSASSGAEIDLILNYDKIECSASSGSDVDIKGQCPIVSLDASSGSGINTKELKSEVANANTSSGADINLLVSEKITANASSGGSINYYGNPKEKNITKSSGGSINNK